MKLVSGVVDHCPSKHIPHDLLGTAGHCHRRHQQAERPPGVDEGAPHSEGEAKAWGPQAGGPQAGGPQARGPQAGGPQLEGPVGHLVMVGGHGHSLLGREEPTLQMQQ